MGAKGTGVYQNVTLRVTEHPSVTRAGINGP
jgi:hypothetical protein